MKKIIVIILTLILFSCEDALVEKPKSIAVKTFYNTPGEVESAIAAIYLPLRWEDGITTVYTSTQEAFSDFFTGRGSFATLSDYQGLDGTNTTRAGRTWNILYLSIRNANLIINNVPNGINLSDNDKNEYIAEAKFLRALAYFHFVRNWGGVPLRTEENMDIIGVSRNTTAEVYQLITNDLNFAQNNLPDVATIAGKPSKWSAKTLMADVYFYQGMNAEASEKANEVIQSGKYSLVGVTTASDFDKIFGPTVVSSSEEIFYFKSSVDNSINLPIYYNGVGTPYLGTDGYYVIHCKPTNLLYMNWNGNDLRKQYDLYLWSTGLGDVYLIKKFSDPTNSSPRNDLPLYRYTDVLLLYAEASCLAANQPTADGVEKLNMVHRRAYGYDPMQPSPFDFKIADYNKQSFADLVIRERLYETIGEGKRWFDLKRTGKVKEYIKANTGKDVTDKHLLWPIPVSELNYNTALDMNTDQNPGY